jgi:hypothetical protein
MAHKASYLVLHWVDASGKKSECRLHYKPAALDTAGGFVPQASIIAAIQAISSAHLDYVEVRHEYVTGTNPPFGYEGSDTARKLLLFFRNASGSRAVSIPSAASHLPFDAAGPYRHTRITRENALLSGVLGDLFSSLYATVLLDGSAFPDSFATGARTRTVA